MIELRQHKELAERWMEETLAFWMMNIGSEVSRAVKNEDKPARWQGAFDRALELMDLTIYALQQRQEYAKMREICYAREEFCSYFYGGEMKVDAEKMQRYYDQFVTLLR